MNKMKKYLFLLFIAGVISTGCKKERDNIIPEQSVIYGDVNFKINYAVDAALLYLDSLMYTNAAGNKYSVTKIQFYLSQFKLYVNNEVKYSSDDIFYLDAKSTNYSQVTLKSLPAIEYDSVSFTIGLDEEQNISNSLPATSENIVMSWPDIMGGGYHFLKLEGHWRDTNGSAGYAMHIGKNGFNIKTGAKGIITVSAGKSIYLTMSMNVNEWCANPNTYDLANDGVYSMGNAALMKKLSENGRDVFSIEY